MKNEYFMKHIVKYTSLALGSVIAFSALASKNIAHSKYELVAYKDCNVVYSMKLNEQQAKAYDQLDKESEVMHQLESPIKKMQLVLEELEEQMHKVSYDAVHETEKLIRIDKLSIQKQTAIAAKIEALIQQHKKDFDAIEKQGYKIQLVAEKFEKLLANEMPDAEDYDHIQIFTDKEQPRECESYRSKL